MMHLTVNRKSLILVFQYLNNGAHRITEAAIYERIENPLKPGTSTRGMMIAFGRARWNPKDKYNKREGRKEALRRAIADWSRDMRAQLWTQYNAVVFPWREIKVEVKQDSGGHCVVVNHQHIWRFDEFDQADLVKENLRAALHGVTI